MDQFPDLIHGQCGAGLIAFGALNGHQTRPWSNRAPDCLIIKGAVRLQIHLAVGDAVFVQGAPGRPDSDYLLQRIIGLSHRGKQFVPGAQIS